jgi:hypothetical protein
LLEELLRWRWTCRGNCSLQHWIVLSTNLIRRCKIITSSVNFLLTNSLTAKVRRRIVHHLFHIFSLILLVKKNTDGFTNEKYTQKKIFVRNIPTQNIPSVMVAYTINIFKLSVKYRWDMSIGIHVGDSGICSKYFSTLGKIPTDFFHM